MMEVVKNVSKIKPIKHSMTTVNIEDADESWAVKILNECDVDNEAIHVQTYDFKNKLDIGYDAPTVKSELPKKEPSTDSFNDLDFNDICDEHEIEASILSLSAIENQMLELAEKQRAQQSSEAISKFSFNLARFKRLFKRQAY